MDRRWDAADRIIQDMATRIATTRNEHIEGFIGQYLARTGLSITAIMLVEQRAHDGSTRWFLAPKDESATPAPTP